MIWGQREISFVGVFKENISCMRSGMDEAVKIVLRDMCSFWLNQNWTNKTVRWYERGKSGNFSVLFSWNFFIGMGLRRLNLGLSVRIFFPQGNLFPLLWMTAAHWALSALRIKFRLKWEVILACLHDLQVKVISCKVLQIKDKAQHQQTDPK